MEPYRQIGHVASEGGPLLLMDRNVLPDWGGSDCGDFERIGFWLDDHPDEPGYEAAVGSSKGLVWELGSAGTAAVFHAEPDRLLLVRAWVPDNDESLVVDAAARPFPGGGTAFGGLTVESGLVVVFWPVDRGVEIDVPADPSDGERLEMPSIDGTGIVVKLPPGRYAAWHDELEADRFSARRCWLLPDGTSPD